MEGPLCTKPRVCYEVEKIIGMSSEGNVRTYRVQWSPAWVTGFHLVGCEHLIQEFLQQQQLANNVVAASTPTVVLTHEKKTNLQQGGEDLSDIRGHENMCGDGSHREDSELLSQHAVADHQEEHISTLQTQLQQRHEIQQQQQFEQNMEKIILQPQKQQQHENNSDILVPPDPTTSSFIELKTTTDNQLEMFSAQEVKVEEEEEQSYMDLNHVHNDDAVGASYDTNHTADELGQPTIDNTENLPDPTRDIVSIKIEDDDENVDSVSSSSPQILNQRQVLSPTDEGVETRAGTSAMTDLSTSMNILRNNALYPWNIANSRVRVDGTHHNISDDGAQNEPLMHASWPPPRTASDYGCTQCGRRCENPTDYAAHMRTHTTEANFACPCCEQTFANVNNLKVKF